MRETTHLTPSKVDLISPASAELIAESELSHSAWPRRASRLLWPYQREVVMSPSVHANGVNVSHPQKGDKYRQGCPSVVDFILISIAHCVKDISSIICEYYLRN